MDKEIYRQTILEMEGWEQIVIFLYNKYPQTINSDNELQTCYENLMNTRLNSTRANSLSRAARKVRQLNSERYGRTTTLSSTPKNKPSTTGH